MQMPSIENENSERYWKKRWNRRVARVVAQVLPIFNPRRLYLGGGHAKHLDIALPPEVQEGEKRRDTDDRDEGSFDEAGA